MPTPTKNLNSTIPELIKHIRHSFRQCEFDEVENTLMDREESMKVEIENLARERDSLKLDLDTLQNTQGFTELEKLSAEEKLGRSERRYEELDKLIVGMRGEIERLRSKKLDLEEKIVRNSRELKEKDERLVKMEEVVEELRRENAYVNKCSKELKARKVEADCIVEELKKKDERLVKMEEEVEELRRENAYVNKCLEELKAKKIEADCIVEELKLKNVEAIQTIDELRAKKIESDKAAEIYERGLSDLNLRVMKAEEIIAKTLSVNMEDLGTLANGTDGFTAAATEVRGMSSREKLTQAASERATITENEPAPQEAAEPGSYAGVMQSGGEVAVEKAIASSSAAGNDIIVVSESDDDDEVNKRDRRRDSAIHRNRKRKRNTSTATDAAIQNVEYVDLEDDSSSSRMDT